MTDFKGLNNDELCMIYYRMNDIKIGADAAIKQKKLVTPKGTVSLNEDEITKFQTSEYYITLSSVIKKLGPIVEIILEEDNSIINKRFV